MRCAACDGSKILVDANTTYTSLVLVRRNLALQRLARPSMFIVPMNPVFIVLIGLYL